MKTALKLATAAAVLAAPAALAQTTSRADTSMDGPYVSIRGGWTQLDDHDYTTGLGPTATEMGDGWIGSAAVGTRRGPLRAEIEGLYTQSDVDHHSVSGVNVGGGGDTRTTAAMGNLYYDLANMRGFRPYVGGGVGYAHVKFKDYNVGGATFMDDGDDVFAYQGMAGVAYDINPCWSVNAEYRYFGTNDAEVTTAGGGTTKVSNDSNNVMVGLTYRF